MLANILQPIEKELQSVHKLIQSQLIIKAGYIGSFAHLEFSPINKTIRPALVILSSRVYGSNPEKTTVLASVFQFIYMASKVHEGISEDDSDYIRGDSDPRDGSQFPVLVGDFLFGKSFTFLCEADMLNMLRPLAEIVCQVHEGGIIRKKITGQDPPPKAFLEVIRKETAELFAGCCALGARLAGAPEEDQKIIRHFGQNVGMAYGLLEQGIAKEYAPVYLEEALNNLSFIPDKPEKNILEKIVRGLSGQGSALRRMAI